MIREQLAETPEKSDRQIAAGLGVHHTTVSTQRQSLVGRGEISHADKIIDTLGREQPRHRKPVSVFNPTPREEKALQKPEVLERLANGATASVINAHKMAMREEKAIRKNIPYALSEDDCRLICTDTCGGSHYQDSYSVLQTDCFGYTPKTDDCFY